MKKIVFIHLLNDFSGSPKVLSQVIDIANASGVEVHLYTCTGGTGFLDRVNAKRFYFPYKHFSNKLLTFFSFFSSQLVLFLKLLKYRNDSDVVFYINTMLPFAAALAGKVMGKKVVIHIHETSIKPRLFKSFLRLMIKVSASKILFVSEYLKINEEFDGVESAVIYNGIESQKSFPVLKSHSDSFLVLMICSLRTYKGVFEFVALAAKFKVVKPEVRFTLILNAIDSEIKLFFQDVLLPTNLTIVSKLSDVKPYYLESNLLVNFSKPDEWIETFGLTIVEGMSYGLPVIVPPVGGPAEIVVNGEQGYLINSCDMEELVSKISFLIDNPVEYHRFASNAFIRAKEFSLEVFRQKIEEFLFEKK